jgi:glycosyltransferase involved in cell wall biosynthesis
MAKQWDGKKVFHEKLINQIELANLKLATCIVVVSKPMRDELIDRGIESNKILINPNGVDTIKYSPCVDGSVIKKRYGLADKLVIGFIGTFGKWHGAEILAESFGLLLKKYPQYKDFVRLFMIGDGQTMPDVKASIKLHHVENACVLTGLIPQEDGPAYLAACDILASPHVPNPDGTPFFGSPTKLFEYMAMGKPIIASDLDQIGEILSHNTTAFMVKPKDSESLVQGIKILIDNKDLRECIGNAAREKVEAEYTWVKHTKKTIDALNSLISST